MNSKVKILSLFILSALITVWGWWAYPFYPKHKLLKLDEIVLDNNGLVVLGQYSNASVAEPYSVKLFYRIPDRTRWIAFTVDAESGFVRSGKLTVNQSRRFTEVTTSSKRSGVFDWVKLKYNDHSWGDHWVEGETPRQNILDQLQ